MEKQHQEKLMHMAKILSTIVGIFFVALTVFVVSKTAAIGDPVQNEHLITVNGEGTVDVVPNQATININTQVRGEDQEATQDLNTETTNELITAIKSAGVAAEDIQTQNYSIYENRVYNPDTNDTEARGWIATQQIRVTVKDLDILGELLNLSNAEGVVNVNGPNYELADTEAYKDQARSAAIADAKKRAKILEDELGVKLGKVASYNEWVNEQPYPYYDARIESAVGFGGASEPNLEAGQEEVSMNVSITYKVR
jgi:hypothetical protein